MTAVETAPAGVVGTRMLRKEDPALLTGEAKYTDDLAIPGALSIALVRSPYAHAAHPQRRRVGRARHARRRRRVHRRRPPRRVGAPMPCAWPSRDDMKTPEHFPLAIDKVATSATPSPSSSPTRTPRRATRVDAVVVDYDPLPAVIDLEDALSDRVVIHEGLGTNKSRTRGSCIRRAKRQSMPRSRRPRTR